jgi:hypothetical protein
MEKLGMQREGHLRKCIYRDETTWWDEYFYALLEEEWFNAVGSRKWCAQRAPVSRGEATSQ